MIGFNREIGESSQIRFDRIAQLLKSTPTPYSLNSFISLSNDQIDGPDNSILRIGSAPGKSRTMALWAVKLPKQGSPEVYVRISNPGEHDKVITINAEDVFTGSTKLP